MEPLSLATVAGAGAAVASAPSVNATTRLPSFSHQTRTRSVAFRRKHKFLVCSSNQENEFSEMEKMEFKAGKMIGEDPRLTLAKIKARRLDPNGSLLDLEKSFYRNKGKLPEIEVIPLDWDKPSREARPARKQTASSVDGLNLVRPVPNRGVQFESSSSKPNAPETRKPDLPVRKPVFDAKRSDVPNVKLRRPGTSKEEGVGEKPSGLRLKPNLSLDTSKAQSPERLSDAKPGVVDDMMLRRPKPIGGNVHGYKKQEPSVGAASKVVDDMKVKTSANENAVLLRKPGYIDKKSELSSGTADIVMKQEAEVKEEDLTLLKKPGYIDKKPELSSGTADIVMKQEAEVKEEDLTLLKKLEAVQIQPKLEGKDVENLLSALDSLLKEQANDNDSDIGLKQVDHSDVGSTDEAVAPREQSATSSVGSGTDMKISVEAALQGRPKRIDQPVRETSESAGAYTDFAYPVESYGSDVELDNSSVASPSKELEDTYWTRAEELLGTGKLEEVELIRPGSGGFVVSLGPLLGVLPYSNLTSGWRFIAFETWLRRNGLDPSKYGENVGIIQSYGIAETNLSPEVAQKAEGGILQNMRLEDLLKIYEGEKSKFLSSLVGQTLVACVKLADRKSRKLIFSMKSKKDDDIAEKKKNLMAKLQIGDVVKCTITQIAYFGVFVEVEGVPALIHQTEVSWDATLDPASYFKIGQELEAKVHQLNFELQRIFLSLRELTPDPLSGALESLIGGDTPFDGRLQAAEVDSEWADVESLIKELQQIEGVQSASKGQFFVSPGLAPTFQVYMASKFEDEYKLLARAGNKLQEVIVRASLDKEEMKAAILTCTNRVE